MKKTCFAFDCSHGSVELLTDEKAAVLELLPKGINNDEIDNVLAILSQVHAGVTSDEDISDQDQVRHLSFIPGNLHAKNRCHIPSN